MSTCPIKFESDPNPWIDRSAIGAATAGVVTLVVCAILAILVSQNVIGLQISAANLAIIGGGGVVFFGLLSLAIKYACGSKKDGGGGNQLNQTGSTTNNSDGVNNYSGGVNNYTGERNDDLLLSDADDNFQVPNFKEEQPQNKPLNLSESTKKLVVQTPEIIPGVNILDPKGNGNIGASGDLSDKENLIIISGPRKDPLKK